MSALVTIFVRHGKDSKGLPCKYSADEMARRCDCRKHLRWFTDGKQHRKSAETRSWAEAELAKRTLEDQLSGKTTETAEPPKTVAAAVETFLAEKKVTGVGLSTQQRYARELDRLTNYAAASGVYTVQAVTRELLTGFCAGWPAIYPSSYTRFRCRERLQGFVKYCYDNEWMRRKLALPTMTIDEPPTMPVTADEFSRLLAACDKFEPVGGARCRGLFLLMRWTGLSIFDALTLERAEFHPDKAKGIYRVTTERQKTGTHVSVPVHAAIAEEILSTPTDNPKYIFWSGTGDPADFSGGFSTKYVIKAFNAAGVVSEGHMKSHRLRDTFAVDLLEKGVPMEEVSKLLGHESIRTTEKHYAKWVKGRQDRLDSLVMGTWTEAA